MGHGIHPRDGDIVRKALGSPPMMVRLWMWRSLQTLALIEPLTDINWHPFGKALNQVGELTIESGASQPSAIAGRSAALFGVGA